MTKESEYPGQVVGCDLAPEIQLNLNVRGLSPSATVAINERSDQLRKEGREIFKLGLGQSPFPVPDIIVEELKKNAFQKDYLAVKGLFELCKAVAEHHRRTFGIECTAEDVLVGPVSIYFFPMAAFICSPISSHKLKVLKPAASLQVWN